MVSVNAFLVVFPALIVWRFVFSGLLRRPWKIEISSSRWRENKLFHRVGRTVIADNRSETGSQSLDSFERKERAKTYRAAFTDILHFPARVSVNQAARGCCRTTLIPDKVLPIYLCDVRPASPGIASRRMGLWVSPSSEPRSALHGHATASMKGHVSHDADRFASTRVRRAATARDVRSAGTASPVPKYISSGVCP